LKQKFVIEGRLASLNDYVLACRTSPWKGNKFKHEQQEKVNNAIKESCLYRVDANALPIKATFVFYEQNQKRDLDNISGWAHKAVMDALVTSGILENDGWKQIVGYTDYFYIDKENPRIEIYLESVKQEESEPKQ
jgi:Holliday junction resolvase RusA-like endonuclease